MECCRFRVKDLNRARGQITVRAGKGDKDRYVMMPAGAKSGLERQLVWRRALHEQDLARGFQPVSYRPTAGMSRTAESAC
jgi:site-specific recombinase XerD